jgi:hypothetical protein
VYFIDVHAGRRSPRAALRCMLLLFAVCCATAAPREPPPDWVEAGGRSARFSDLRYVTGFAAAEPEVGLDSVKQRAAADLAARLEVRIEHELRDVSEEKDGVYSYHVAALTRSTVDLKLSGLAYQTYRDGRAVYALAVLERGPAAQRRRALRDLAIAEMRQCLGAAADDERVGRSGRAVEAYEFCRRPLAQALEHNAVVGALTGVDAQDRAAHLELVAATRTISDQIEDLLRKPAATPESAAESLALQLERQGVSKRARLVVTPFTYGTADLSSAFGRRMALDLESALARRSEAAAAGESAATLIVHGVYLERGDAVRIDVTVKEAETARLLASAGTSLPRAAVPDDLELRPSNFFEALEAQRALSEGDLVSGDLRVELWTSKGRRGVVFTEREEFHVYLRVNRPAYVRLVYILQNGAQVPIDHSFHIGAARVNFVVEYPHAFQVVPPFGVEYFYATAFTVPPPRLTTRRQVIDGVPYEVVPGGLEEIKRTRGNRIRNDEPFAEAFVAVTTTPRAAVP